MAHCLEGAMSCNLLQVSSKVVNIIAIDQITISEDDELSDTESTGTKRLIEAKPWTLTKISTGCVFPLLFLCTKFSSGKYLQFGSGSESI